MSYRRTAVSRARRPGQWHVHGMGDATTDLVTSNAVRTASGALLVYHGYRRTGSLLWALIYGIAGRQVPVIAVPVALAQGLGKKKTCTTE